MAELHKRKMYYISQIDTEIGLWSVNVQVVETHRSQVTSGRNGAPQKNFKRFLLVDENGTKVSGVLYENDIHYFSNSLQQFKRYRISNAKLIPAYSFFKVGDYGFSWVIKSDTPVEALAEAVPPQIPFTYPVCPFNEFILHADKDSGFKNCKLLNMEFHGPRFTWTGPMHKGIRIEERLDQVWTTSDWLVAFPNSTLLHLPKVHSDHCPLLLRLSVRQKNCRGGGGKRFLNAWLEHEGFLQFVDRHWDNSSTNMKDNIQKFMAEAQIWNKNVFGNIVLKDMKPEHT